MARGIPAAKGYRLTRNFAVVCLIVLAAAGVAMTKLNLDEANRRLIAMAENHNDDLAKVLARTLWPRYGTFIGHAGTLGADAIREAPETAALMADARAMMRGSRMIKVKIYDLAGFTVFSTDPSQIGGDYSANPHFLAALAHGASSELEHRARFETPDGARENIWVLSSYIPIVADGSERVGVFEIYSDVTGLRAVTRQSLLYHARVASVALLGTFLLLFIVVLRIDWTLAREQARNLDLAANAARAEAASRAKSEFLANMSHELRTPLNAIIGFADLIKSETMGPIGTAAYRGYAEDIGNAGSHLLETINDVLNLARVESGELAIAKDSFDLRDAIAAVLRLLQERAAEKRHTLTFHAAPDPLVIEGDEYKIRQVLINLISNAIKFTPDGGFIRVDASVSPEGSAMISVADTGIGMREADIPLALTPFGQIDASLSRRHGGTGLGLTLSQKLAEAMGGRLEIASAPGHGTTVTVILPGHPPARRKTDAA